MRKFEITEGRKREEQSPRGILSELSWKNLTIRCGAPDCSMRVKVQPAWLTRYRGIQFQQNWYHEVDCLQEALLGRLYELLIPTRVPVSRAHRLPLGLLLVKRGAITPEELREGLRLQKETGTGKLGYWLRQISTLTEDQICGALSQQWACPVFPLERHVAPPIWEQGVPFPLLAAAKAVPAFTTMNGQQWHVAFSDHVDHSLLYAMEEMLDCRTIACVSRESAIKECLEWLRRKSETTGIVFDTVRDPAEMAATICSYAAQLDIRTLKVVRAAGYLWVAFFRNGVRRDLLFRLRTSSGAETTKAVAAPADIRRDGVSKSGEEL